MGGLARQPEATSDPCTCGERDSQSVGRRLGWAACQGLRHADVNTCAWSLVLVTRSTRYRLGRLSRIASVSDPRFET